jgi:membrane-associated phospholipid phosphatase
MNIETPYQDTAIDAPIPVLPVARDWRAARWVSRIASPPVLAISGTLISAAEITSRQTSGNTAYWWALFIVTLTVLLPSSYIFYQVKRGKVTDFDVYLRGQRFWPYVISIVCAAVSWLVLAVAHAPRLLIVLSGASVGQGLIMFIVNQRWKISVHAAGSASIAVIIWQIFGAAGSPALLIIPLVGWSRVRLGKHSPLQVIVGASLGAVVFLGALLFWF